LLRIIHVEAMKVTLSIPESLARRLTEEGLSVEHRIALDLALHYYQSGFISLGKAVELSGLQRSEFENLLAERKIDRPSSSEYLEEDLDWSRAKQ
jgi:predicted HTH domain antitoxin